MLPNPQQPFQDQAGYRSHRSPRPAGRGMVSSPVHHGSDPYLLEDAGVLSGCHSTPWEAPPLPSNLRASGQHYQLSAKKHHKPGTARMGAHLLSPPMGDEPFQEGQSHLEMYHCANFNFRDFAPTLQKSESSEEDWNSASTNFFCGTCLSPTEQNLTYSMPPKKWLDSPNMGSNTYTLLSLGSGHGLETLPQKSHSCLQ